jgi:hypothetical protein
MLQEMSIAAKQSQRQQKLLVDIRTSGAVLAISETGHGVVTLDGRSITFGREIGRYALRRLYLGTWGVRLGAHTVRQMVNALDECRRCKRTDCNALVPEGRRLVAFDHDQPVRYCSNRCQRTEATRRYRLRRKSR